MVSLTWNALPRGARAAYPGVVFQGVPVINGKRNLRVTDRLLSVNFLRLPGRYRSSGRFTRLQVAQAPRPKVLRFLPRVRNTGDVIAAPTHTSLVVESASGRHLYRRTWPGDVVLPGAARDFAIDVRHVFGAGDYTAVAVMDFGSSKHRIVRTSFHLTGPNTLPSPGLAITRFGGNGEIGRPAHLTARVASTGTAPVTTTVHIALYHVTGGPGDATPVAATHVRYVKLAPGQVRGLDLRLGRVAAGHYRAVLSYRDPTDVARSLSAEFDATRQLSFSDRIRRFFDDHGVLAVSLLALLALLLIVAWFRRRQRRLERELAAPAAAPPAPAGPASAVDINTASVDELQQLPGVGPRAAQRIVEHREEYGAFADVGDLAAVDGFDTERIAGLAGAAVV
jgi:competence ComEA-like helix-hairpin-helix protein